MDSLDIDLKHTHTQTHINKYMKLEGKKLEGGIGREEMVVDWIKHIICINEYYIKYLSKNELENGQG